MPDYERVAVEKVLTAVFRRDYPTLSEQLIRSMVFREIDDIIKTRKLQIESKAITRQISAFAETLADLGVNSVNVNAYDVNAGRMFVIDFILPKGVDTDAE